jgi:membrane protein YdbS with pleckstrin-like domain
MTPQIVKQPVLARTWSHIMQCSACGADIPEDAVFCAKCGHNLNNGGGDTTQPAAPESKGTSRGAAERFKNATGPAGDEDEDDEEVTLWKGGYSAKAMVGSWILAAVASVLFIAGALYFRWSWRVPVALVCLTWISVALVLAYRKLGVYYELTTQRFIHKTGILKRTSDRLEVIDIDDVTFSQGLIQRLVNVGTVRISSSDRTHPELELIGIENVQVVADNIDDVRRKERRRRGLHIEAI